MWKGYLSHKGTAKAQVSLRIGAVTPELTPYMELQETSTREPEVWPYCVAAHAHFKDLKLHGANEKKGLLVF